MTGSIEAAGSFSTAIMRELWRAISASTIYLLPIAAIASYSATEDPRALALRWALRAYLAVLRKRSASDFGGSRNSCLRRLALPMGPLPAAT
ncbi:hypothetical protein JCM18897A_37760 [Streptomyces sp. JCM 18897]